MVLCRVWGAVKWAPLDVIIRPVDEVEHDDGKH